MSAQETTIQLTLQQTHTSSSHRRFWPILNGYTTGISAGRIRPGRISATGTGTGNVCSMGTGRVAESYTHRPVDQ